MSSEKFILSPQKCPECKDLSMFPQDCGTCWEKEQMRRREFEERTYKKLDPSKVTDEDIWEMGYDELVEFFEGTEGLFSPRLTALQRILDLNPNYTRT